MDKHAIKLVSFYNINFFNATDEYVFESLTNTSFTNVRKNARNAKTWNIFRKQIEINVRVVNVRHSIINLLVLICFLVKSISIFFILVDFFVY